MEEKYFLAKWLNNEITEEELKKHVSEEEIRLYKKIISASDMLETPEFDLEEALSEIKKLHEKTNVKKLTTIKYFYKVAAVLALIVTSYYFISNKNTNYTTQLAEKISFELPDNSSVNLNADSEIKFKPNKWENKRELHLKGEAFFSVKKGSKFTVKTNLGDVSVLGTKFNVVARDHFFEVFCYEGVVSATYQNKTIKIPAGTSFKALNSSSAFNPSIEEKIPSWLQNKSSFKSLPFKYVIKEFERQYNIKITYDKEFDTILFTGNFTHKGLEIALQAISVPLNLNYTIINEGNVSLHP